MGLGGHFVVFFTGRELAFCSSKHFWHSLKKHIVGFQVVFKNQSSFFSETSSWNPINLQDLNRHFLSKCSWGTHFCMQLIAAGVRVFAFIKWRKKNSVVVSKSSIV